jgi:hypothetical protein
MTTKEQGKNSSSDGKCKGNGNSNSKSEMRGFLHSATHDETVSSFGRNDAVVGWVGKAKASNSNTKCGDPSLRSG